MTKLLAIFVAGVLAVFAVKYLVVGLRVWDTYLHPERLEADLNGPLKAFNEPLLSEVWD